MEEPRSEEIPQKIISKQEMIAEAAKTTYLNPKIVGKAKTS